MRLIDAECNSLMESIGRKAFNTRQDIQDWLDNAPTVDAVKVVRCKNCKYRKDGLYCRLRKSPVIVTNTDFCSYGKIKMEDKLMSYSDKTLMSMTKAQLIEQLRCAEHNRNAMEERLNQQAENVKGWEPVVHCGECSFYNKFDDGCDLAVKLPYSLDSSDYCSRGQK